MKNRRRGSAIVETALLMPWIFFLFVGVMDLGFFSYAAICIQNAARAGALAASASQNACSSTAVCSANACAAALGELNYLPNAVTVTTCASSPGGITNTQPIAVCAGQLTNSVVSVCGLPAAACADCGINPAATSAVAAVTYQSIPLVPIPGILMGRMTLTRTAEVRIFQQP